MDTERFDRLTRRIAGRFTRRQAVVGGVAGVAAASLSTTGPRGHQHAAARQATPSPEGAPSGASGSPSFLFVQTYHSGSFIPEADQEGIFALTLSGGLGQTVYFSDRPDRAYGMASTQDFMQRVDFGPENPPNAALVLQAQPDDEMVVVLELTEPTYDEASRTATYRGAILTEYEHLRGVVQSRPIDHLNLPTEFGASSLFIDSAQFLSCCDGTVRCITGSVWYGTAVVHGTLPPVAKCGGCGGFYCSPCDAVMVDELCNHTFPSCNGECHYDTQCSSDLSC